VISTESPGMAGDSVQPEEPCGIRLPRLAIPPSALGIEGFDGPMNIDNFKPAIVYTIYIASTPEKVWQALTTAEFSRQYFFRLRVEAELKVAARSPPARRMVRFISAAKC